MLHMHDFEKGRAIAHPGEGTTLVSQVMVVEDFEPYRRFVTSLLCEHVALQVVCEVVDGLQAVERAQELNPDLTLMDIGLPGLNGIEAARRILNFQPGSKILFLTQETSSDVVHEALAIGACGYVVKSRAARDLLPAINAALQGKRFVSGGLDDYEPTKEQSPESAP